MMNVTDYTNIKTLLVKFKEKSDVLYAKAAALSNYATIEWVGTQIPSVGNGTVTIKQNGTSKGSFSMNQSGGATINLTDTTYSSLSAVSGGTDKSLVTTGEKYTWNNKQAAISDLATIRSNAATAYGWGDHSKAGYITGITKAMVEGVLTGNITSHTHTFASLALKPTTLSGYGITDASRFFRYTIPASGNKGVRITFTSGEPVKITVSGANQGAQLVLIGTGYGEGGFSRNNFTEVVPSTNALYTWCVSEKDARSVEIFSARAVPDVVTVESPSLVTFTAISALSTNAAYRHLLTSANYSSYALPLTGGTIRGLLTITANANYGLTVNSILENSKAAGINFQINGTTYGRVLVKDTKELLYNDMTKTYTVYHSGNCNLPTVPWTCSSLTANSVTARRGEFGYIEFSNIDSSANNGGYIDFHYNGNTADYTSRIIEDAAGQLTLSAGIVNIGTAAKGFLYLQRPSANYIWANKAGGAICIGTADGGETSALNSGITIIGKRVYIGGTNSGSNALNVKGAIHATTGIYTDGYISAKQASASSDRRLKKDFCKIDNALKYVLKTHYTRFRWKDDNKESIGIIAQEEQNREYGFLVQNNEKIGHLTYDYAASTALLGAAIQEEDSKVEKLRKRIIKLENELSNLKKKWQH